MRLLLLLAVLAMTGCKERAPRLEQDCTFNQDCMLTTLNAKCCDGCELEIGTVASVTARSAYCAQKPGVACPVLGCQATAGTAFCQNGRCLLRQGIH